MNWQSCFEKYKYKSLISEDKNENEKILMEMFYEDGKCIFRKNRALAPHERSAVPLGTDHCPVG